MKQEMIERRERIEETDISPRKAIIELRIGICREFKIKKEIFRSTISSPCVCDFRAWSFVRQSNRLLFAIRWFLFVPFVCCPVIHIPFISYLPCISSCRAATMNIFFHGKKQKNPAELVKSLKETLQSVAANPKTLEKVLWKYLFYHVFKHVTNNYDIHKS